MLGFASAVYAVIYIRHPAWKRNGTILVEWEGMKNRKIDEASKKAKKGKVKYTKR